MLYKSSQNNYLLHAAIAILVGLLLLFNRNEISVKQIHKLQIKLVEDPVFDSYTGKPGKSDDAIFFFSGAHEQKFVIADEAFSVVNHDVLKSEIKKGEIVTISILNKDRRMLNNKDRKYSKIKVYGLIKKDITYLSLPLINNKRNEKYNYSYILFLLSIISLLYFFIGKKLKIEYNLVMVIVSILGILIVYFLV